MTKKLKVLAVSSPGGHWVQLSRLLPIFNENEVVYASTYIKPVELDKSDTYYIIEDISRDSLKKIFSSMVKIFSIINKEKPSHVITTGALPGLIAILIARSFGIKTIWLDSIANSEKMSASGMVASFVAHDCLTQWEHLSSSRIKYIGRVI